MKRWILGLCSALTLLTPMTAYATEKEPEQKEKGVLGITALYSDSVTPKGGDEFTITLADDEGNTTDCIFQAYEHQNKAQFFELDPGNYSIYDITYDGDSEKLIAEGFVIPQKLTVYEQEHLDISLAIGKDKGTDLASTFVNTYAVIKGEPTDWIEFYSPRNNHESLQEENSTESENKEESAQTESSQEETGDIEEMTETKETDDNEKESKKETSVKKENIFVKNLPIFFAAGITALAVFVLHKKGKL
nr:hypothetical protein [uncultured Blautia sp.]